MLRKASKDLPALSNLGITLILFGSLLLGLIWSGLHYKIQNERQLEIDNAVKQTANLTRTFEELTLRIIKSADQAALFLKYQYEQDGPKINIPRYLKEGRFAGQPFVQLGIIDENGGLAATSQVPFTPVRLGDRDHFRVHKGADSGRLFISKPVLGRASGKWSLQMTRRINKPDGSFGGVAVVSVDPYYFTHFYHQINLGKNSVVVLIGRDWIVRARLSGQDASLGQDLRNTDTVKKLTTGIQGHYTAKSPVDGVTRLYSYRAMREYPLIVLVGVDETEFFRALNQRIASYYIAAGIVTIIIIGFILVLLNIAARQKIAETALKQAHDNLESQVEVRTQELYTANRELKNINQDLQKEIIERNHAEEALQQQAETIRHMAYTDSLTGLANRVKLNEWLNEEMENARRGNSAGAVLFIDLDELKMVNDTYGHSSGDGIIVEAGARIVAAAGPEAFVARIGGDEFIAVLPGIDRRAVEDISGRIIESLRQKHNVSGKHYQMTASIGIAAYPADGDTAEEIVKNADNAMYAAKRDGKNCWRFYTSDMQAQAYKKMRLTNSMRYALDHGEFTLHYQPQILAANGAVVGFEALLRWNSSEHGPVPPVQFIPLAEKSGLIHPIGQWALREACRFARLLAERGAGHIHIAVNISSKQLATNDFIDIIRRAVDESGIEPQQLELEITESSLMASLEDATAKLTDLRNLGVTLSLDDFGTGYSSLTHLLNLPVETLKIDKSFIDMIATDVNVSKIIGSIINMAHILDKTVTAEGVETEQQLTHLAGNGCDYIQGYLYGRPMPETEAFQYLAAHPLQK